MQIYCFVLSKARKISKNTVFFAFLVLFKQNDIIKRQKSVVEYRRKSLSLQRFSEAFPINIKLL